MDGGEDGRGVGEHVVADLHSRHQRDERRAEIGELPDHSTPVRENDGGFQRIESLGLLTGIGEVERPEPEEPDHQRGVVSAAGESERSVQ